MYLATIWDKIQILRGISYLDYEKKISCILFVLLKYCVTKLV